MFGRPTRVVDHLNDDGDVAGCLQNLIVVVVEPGIIEPGSPRVMQRS
jgi:hypothetical protein